MAKRGNGVSRRIFEKEERGLSPVIATVLLITLVVVIALIVFFWIRGMTQETITKFGGDGDPINIQLVCDQVSFDASYSEDTLYISNPGNVPIFDMNVKVVGEGSHQTLSLREQSSPWPPTGLNQGGVFSDPSLTLSGNEIVLVPVLLGESDKGRKTYTCDEAQYGYQIMI